MEACANQNYWLFFFILSSRYIEIADKINQTKNSYKGVWVRRVHMAILKMNNQQGPTAQHRGPCPKPHSSLEGTGGEPRTVSSTDDAGKTVYPHATTKKGSWILTSHHLQRTNSKWIKNLNMHVPLLSTQNHHNTVSWPHSNTK